MALSRPSLADTDVRLKAMSKGEPSYEEALEILRKLGLVEKAKEDHANEKGNMIRTFMTKRLLLQGRSLRAR